MTKPTTGKYSVKPYNCDECDALRYTGTNHWGKFYNTRCNECYAFASWSCAEPAPNGYSLPEEWKVVRLGDLVDIVSVGNADGE